MLGLLKLAQGPKRAARQPQDTPKTASKAPRALDGPRAPPRRPKRARRQLKRALGGRREGPKGRVSLRWVCRGGAGALEVFPGTQEGPNTAKRDAQDGLKIPRALPAGPTKTVSRDPRRLRGGPRAPPDCPGKPQDGPRGSHKAANTAQEGPLFDEFASGLPWCRCALSPSGGPWGPAKTAQQHLLFDQFAAALLRCWGV